MIIAKPKFEDGKFKVEYIEKTALLSWPKPSGDFSRQAVQKTPGTTKKTVSGRMCGRRCATEPDLTHYRYRTREGFLRKNIVAVSFFQNCAIHQYS